jgi:hypothetical protein
MYYTKRPFPRYWSTYANISLAVASLYFHLHIYLDVCRNLNITSASAKHVNRTGSKMHILDDSVAIPMLRASNIYQLLFLDRNVILFSELKRKLQTLNNTICMHNSFDLHFCRSPYILNKNKCE